MIQARRIYLYVMAFAGLLALLTASAGLLGLIVVTLGLPRALTMTPGDARQEASFYLAAIIIGLAVWVGHWLPAERLAARSGEDRASAMRRLFLAAVFASTAVIALYGLRGSLTVLLTLPGAALGQPSWAVGIRAAFRFLVFGGGWLAFARLARPARADALHDLAVYVVAGFGLGFLAWGSAQAVAELVRSIVIQEAGGARVLLGGPAGLTWTVWGAVAAWILSGGGVWGLTWVYDARRGGRRIWRVIYLYVVLAAAMPAALGGLGYGLYELLRRGLGYTPTPGFWDFLQTALPVVVVGGGVWLCHWPALRRQADFQPDPEAGAAGAIAWPRRPALALLALLGMTAAAVAFVALIWVGLDFAFNTTAVLSGPAWWRDRLSLSLAGGLVGSVTWLAAWALLERAAAARPDVECASLVRRLYLGIVVIGGALASSGFLVALLWLVFRLLLGEPLTPPALTSLFKYSAAVAAGAGLAAYHALISRRDVGRRRPGESRVRLFVLLEPGAEAALASLKRDARAEVRVLGQIRGHGTSASVPVEQVLDTAGRLAADTRADREFVILGPSQGRVFAYGAPEPAKAPAS